MSSLAAITFTTLGGLGFFTVTLGFFGWALKSRSTFIAARCTARPLNVIYNPNPEDPCQDRGSPWFGWIRWTMKLTYPAMLEGIPGTGTRDGGLSGALLKVNLDGIVLLRFHHLCLRVSFFAMVLYVVILLPLYISSHRSDVDLKDFEKLTLANIPVLKPHESTNFFAVLFTFFRPNNDSMLARLYVLVFCTWLVTGFAMFQLKEEWVDVLAMRRVYYLEADHWNDRKEELAVTLLAETGDDDSDDVPNDKQTSTKNQQGTDDLKMHRREPWIPHPEQRDTVPNIALYSLLVGGLPSLPTEAVDNDAEAVFSRKQSIDWQLSVTTAFFDHCVPNQPGFSSSVAAVTILPAASDLTEAWNHWYKAARKLRRLRFIRRQIADRRHFEIDDSAYPEDEEAPKPPVPPLESSLPKKKKKKAKPTIPIKQKSVYKECDIKKRYYQEVLGAITDLEVENNLLHALNFGPEQTAVYSREFALSAANLAPNGWFEERIRRARIDELVLMEQIAVEEVHEANIALRRAQEAIAAENDLEENVSDREFEVIMRRSSQQGSEVAERLSLSGSSNDNFGSFGGSSCLLQSDVESDTICDDDDDIEIPALKEEPLCKEDATAPGSSMLSDTPTEEIQSQNNFRQMILNTTQEAFTLGTSLLGIPTLKRAASLPIKRRSSNVDLASAQLPDDLGLEAELWMKHKNQSQINSGSRPFSTKSDLSASSKSKNSKHPFRQKKGRGSSQDFETKIESSGPDEMQLPPRARKVRRRREEELSRHTHHGSSPLHTYSASIGGIEKRPERAKSAGSADLILGYNAGQEPSILEAEKSNDANKMQPDRTKSAGTADLGLSYNIGQEYSNNLKAEPSQDSSKNEGVPDMAPPSDFFENGPKETQAETPSDQAESTKLIEVGYSTAEEKEEVWCSSAEVQDKADENKSRRLQSTSTAELAPFWDKLEEANGRTSRLRARLTSIKKSNSQDSSHHSIDSGFGSRFSQLTLSQHDAQNVDANPNNTSSGLSDIGENHERPINLPHALNDTDLGDNHDMQSLPTSRIEPVPNDVSTMSRSIQDANDQINALQSSPLLPFALKEPASQISISAAPSLPSNTSPLGESPKKSPTPLSDDADICSEGKSKPHSSYRQDSQGNENSRRLISEDSRRSLTTTGSLNAPDSGGMLFDFETKAGLREPEKESSLRQRPTAVSKTTRKWDKVVSIVKEFSGDGMMTGEDGKSKKRVISNGSWRISSFTELFSSIPEHVRYAYSWGKSKIATSSDVVDDLSRDSTYAVVTFTSRQAAVAARHCLADSRGADRWITVSELPVPPLADAPVCNVKSFRGCVRPVTLSINHKQKLLRRYLALTALGTIYIFYTIPLVAVQKLVEPESLQKILPNIILLQENSIFWSNVFSGLIPALVWTGFFAICPALFKIVANFGSNATSSVIAENCALNYFWWFMVTSAFSGISLQAAVRNGFNGGIRIGAEVQHLIAEVARVIPTEIAATWLNWMIVRFTMVLPTQYLLQLNTFIFAFFRLKCCSRVVRGGGAGGPVPYRIYIDSGVVMLCLFGLAPASPLVSVAAFFYFLFCTPLLRWTMIFLYKPRFDIGGQRFPFIFDMCVSGMLVGQILLTAEMSIKHAVGPAIIAALPIVPTILFRLMMRRRYLRAFTDAALLQTSLLDGWDINEETSAEKREEFRRFLVDCHKAAYVPVCIASDATTMITAEPAVVVPLEGEEEEYDGGTLPWDHSAVQHGSIRLDTQFQPESYRMPQSQRNLQPQSCRRLRRASQASQSSQFFRRSSFQAPHHRRTSFQQAGHYNRRASHSSLQMSQRLSSLSFKFTFDDLSVQDNLDDNKSQTDDSACLIDMALHPLEESVGSGSNSHVHKSPRRFHRSPHVSPGLQMNRPSWQRDQSPRSSTRQSTRSTHESGMPKAPVL